MLSNIWAYIGWESPRTAALLEHAYRSGSYGLHLMPTSALGGQGPCGTSPDSSPTLGIATAVPGSGRAGGWAAGLPCFMQYVTNLSSVQCIVVSPGYRLGWLPQTPLWFSGCKESHGVRKPWCKETHGVCSCHQLKAESCQLFKSAQHLVTRTEGSISPRYAQRSLCSSFCI